jgi:hypothetical protein
MTISNLHASRAVDVMDMLIKGAKSPVPDIDKNLIFVVRKRKGPPFLAALSLEAVNPGSNQSQLKAPPV